MAWPSPTDSSGSTDGHLGAQSMAQPPRPDLRDLLHAGNVACGVAYLLYGLGLHSIQQAGKDCLARLPDDYQDGRRYEQTHERVGEGVAQPHPYGSGQDGEARPAVGSCVVPVRAQPCAPYLPADPDAEHGDRLVAQEAGHRSRGEGPKHPYRLRVDESLYGLVSGHHRAEENDQHDEHPGQVLYSPVAEREAPADAQT